MSESDLRGTAIRSAAWSLADKWGVRVSSLLTFAVLGRLLTPQDFGVIATAQVFIALLQTFSSDGFVKTLVVRSEMTERTCRSATTISLLVALATAGAICVCAPSVGDLLGQDDVAVVLMALSTMLVVRALGVVPSADLQRRMQFKALARRNVGSAIGSAVIGLSAAFAGLGVWALVVQAISQVVIATALAWLASSYKLQVGYDWGVVKSLLRFAFPVMCADLLGVVLTQGDNLVVAAALGSVALGYYVIAFRLLNVVTDAFTGVISSVALPVFARLTNDPERAKRAYLEATRLSFALAAPIFLALTFVAPVAVPLAFGPQWDESIPLFQILCFAGIAASVLYFDRPLLIAEGRVRLELIVTAVLALATILAATVGVIFGLTTTALLVTARMYITWPVRFIAIRQVIPVTLLDYFRAIRGPWLSAVAQVAASGVTLAVLPTGTASILTAGALGVLVFGVSLRWTDRAFSRDLRNVLVHLKRGSAALASGERR